MVNKTDLRIKAKELRKNLDISALSLKIIEKIRSQDFYNNAHNVLLYYPLKYEINLLDLINDNKNFYLPKVKGTEIVICPYEPGDILAKSSLNVDEPCTEPVNADILDLAFVPALMVDKFNYRLGYGGGFYDRFIEKYPQVFTVTAISKMLVIDKLPHETYDKPVDFIISC